MVSGKSFLKRWTAIITVSAIVSAVTAYAVVQINSQIIANSTDILSHSILSAQLPPSTFDCEQLVYSPVQNKCVTAEVFDQEMAWLFSALGIDSSIYKTNSLRE